MFFLAQTTQPVAMNDHTAAIIASVTALVVALTGLIGTIKSLMDAAKAKAMSQQNTQHIATNQTVNATQLQGMQQQITNVAMAVSPPIPTKLIAPDFSDFHTVEKPSE